MLNHSVKNIGGLNIIYNNVFKYLFTGNQNHNQIITKIYTHLYNQKLAFRSETNFENAQFSKKFNPKKFLATH